MTKRYAFLLLMAAMLASPMLAQDDDPEQWTLVMKKTFVNQSYNGKILKKSDGLTKFQVETKKPEEKKVNPITYQFRGRSLRGKSLWVKNTK